VTSSVPPSTGGAARRVVSLRAQLTFWFLAISLVIHVTLLAVLLLYQRIRTGEPAERRLRTFADSAAAHVRGSVGTVTDDDLVSWRDRSRMFPAEVPRALVIFDPSGTVVASSLRPPPTPAEAGLDRAFASGKQVVTTVRIAGLRDEAGNDGALTIVVPSRGADGSTLLVWAAANDPSVAPGVPPQILWAVLAAEIVAISIAGWMIAGLAIRPFFQLRAVAASLSPEALEKDLGVISRSSEVLALERDLQETRVKLRSALHAQDRFVSTISHELKTPIAILMTEAQTLPPDSVRGEGRRFVTSVVEEMRRLGRMTESFLMLTRVRGGSSIPNPRPYDINEFVLEAISDCQHQARKSGVEIAARFAENGRPLTVAGDPELLRVMTHNLIRNAVRFSVPGGTVKVGVSERDGEGLVSVRDFGERIGEGELVRVFGYAFQSQAAVRPPGEPGPDGDRATGEECEDRGRSLGLAIAQGIAELHGGGITAINAPDAGCEFVVRIPLRAVKPRQTGVGERPD